MDQGTAARGVSPVHGAGLFSGGLPDFHAAGNRFGCEVPEVWSERGIAKWRNETDRIVLKTADIGQVLGDAAGGSLGLISVSNLPDVLDDDAWESLVENAAKALAPGGYLIVRSMLRETIVTGSDASYARETNVPEDRPRFALLSGLAGG